MPQFLHLKVGDGNRVAVVIKCVSTFLTLSIVPGPWGILNKCELLLLLIMINRIRRKAILMSPVKLNLPDGQFSTDNKFCTILLLTEIMTIFVVLENNGRT